jgi:hypothetical protein
MRSSLQASSSDAHRVAQIIASMIISKAANDHRFKRSTSYVRRGPGGTDERLSQPMAHRRSNHETSTREGHHSGHSVDPCTRCLKND